MKYYFIYNPAAGQGVTGKKFISELKKIQQTSNLDITLYQTTGIGDATNYAESIARENKGTDICVFACGGDGTTNEVISGIAEFSNVIFGIIPTGSCNDFLKQFPKHDFLNIDAQLNGNVVPCDLIKVDDFYCLNVTNIGFDAKVNFDQINYRPRFKTIKGAYNFAILKNIIKPLSEKVLVRADDKIIHNGKAVLMAFGNGCFYGGGYNCTPEAKIDDGIIDVIVVKKVSLLRFLFLIGKYKKGLIYNNPKYKKIIKCVKAKTIEVESPKTLTVCIDGETIHKNHVMIQIEKHKTRFILPNLKYEK